MSQNKLTISQSKKNVMTFGLNMPSKLNWNEVKLEEPAYAKSPGVWLDKDLNYIQHLRVMKNKCTKFFSLLSDKNYLSASMLITILKFSVRPFYQYRSLLYGTASRSHLGAPQRQQNYLVRIILGLKRTDEVRTYRKKNSILSIFEFHVYELFKLLCRIGRREYHSSFVNNSISTSEINRCV